MMFSFSRSSLGIDLGSSSIKWVLVRSGLRQHLLASGTIPTKGERTGPLLELRQSVPAPPGAVVATLPATRVYFQGLELPFRDPRKVEAVLAFELESHLPRPVEGLQLDALTSRAGCLAVALEPEGLEPLREALSSAGLAPRVLEPDVLAAARALLMHGEPDVEGQRTLLVDLGESKTGFVLLEGGHPVRAGSLRSGVGALVEAIAERGALSEEEARARLHERGMSGPGEASVVAARYGRLRTLLRPAGGEAKRLVLCGGGALVPGLAAMLGQLVQSAEVQILDPAGLGPAMAAAWGAAQRGLNRAAPCSVRLLSAEPETSPFWTQGRRRVAGALAAAAVVAGALDLHQQLAFRRSRLAMLEQSIERAFRSVAPEVGRIVNAPAQLRVRIDEMERRVALVPDAGEDPTHPLAVLAAVSGAVGRETKLDIFSYTHSESVVHLEGEIDSLGALSALQAALGRLAAVQQVEVGQTRRSVSSDRVGFQLDLVLMRPEAEASR
jgi:general secretion pathway protein L